MDDTMRFTPGDIQVRAGETVRFFIKNTGKIPHEMVIGSIADLKAHAAEMQKMPGMQHSEPNMITLDPGKIGGLVWQFDQAGTVDRSEEHTSELQSLMRISYAVFCLKKKKDT